jgi:uncharacterized protein (DUF302 family)
MKYIISYVKGFAFEVVVEKLTNALKNEGFIILTNIDVKATLAEEISVNIKPYQILCIINHVYFYELLKCEDNIGLVFPSHIIVKQHQNQIEIVSVDPETYKLSLNNDIIDKMASAIHYKLRFVLDTFYK